MSQPSSSSPSSFVAGHPTRPTDSAHDYALSSDLAKLCLPATFRDENKRLGWINSICLLFLCIGLIGLKMPKFTEKELPEIVEVVPVIFTPPEEPPPSTTELKPDEPEPVQDPLSDAPVIATVVAADASKVAFAVPVKGPVILAPAQFAPPPPAEIRAAPPKPTTFIPSAGQEGTYPKPQYPRTALQQRQQGTVMLYVVVDASGKPVTVEIKDSSGYSLLDKHAVDWIRDRWQWPVGQTRYYYVPVVFQIK